MSFTFDRPPKRQRALSFEEIEEEYMQQQLRGRISIQIDDESGEESGDNSDEQEATGEFEMNEVSPRFQVERVLGKGSYGLVVRAADSFRDGKLVAIKVWAHPRLPTP